MKRIFFTLTLGLIQLICKGQAGMVDSTFNGTGINQLHLEDQNLSVASVAIGDDGAIVISGSSTYGLTEMAYVAKYGGDGTLDNSFGDVGIVNLSYEATDLFPNRVKVQPDHKILIIGQAQFATFICRLLPDGSTDLEFGSGGYVIIDNGLQSTYLFNMVLQSDGKIIVAGNISDNLSYTDFMLMRLNADGTIDDTFGDGGFTRTSLYDYGSFTDLFLTADEDIVLSGYASDDGLENKSLVLKYTNDGLPDATFGEAGITTLPAPVGITEGTFLKTVDEMSDGKIIAVENTYDDEGNSPPYVYRLLADGTLDTSFNHTGFTFIYDPVGKVEITSALVGHDDKIIIAGEKYNDISPGDNYIVRLQTDGDLDTTFQYIAPPLPLEDEDFIRDMVEQPDYRIVLAGHYYSASAGSDAKVMRLLNDQLLSIHDIANVQAVAYPNPSTGLLNISSAMGMDIANIFDMNGNKIREFQLTGSTENYTLNMRNFLPGNYVVQLIGKDKMATVKIQKL